MEHGTKIPAPYPCLHGHGANCECQLPHFEGLWVVSLVQREMRIKPGTRGREQHEVDVTHHRIVRCKLAYDGGMVEFIDPVTLDVVGCMGVSNWNADNATPVAEFMAADRGWPNPEAGA